MEKGMYMVLVVAAVAVVSLVFLTMNAGKGFSTGVDSVTGLPVASTCSDSDGGINPTVFGSTTGQVNANAPSGTSVDSCPLAPNRVNERYCNAQGYRATYSGSCPSLTICQNGACVAPSTPICTDTDGGQNYGVIGSVTSLVSSPYNTPVGDTCQNPSILKEYYCNSNGYRLMQTYSCPSQGKICQNGACVTPTSSAIGDLTDDHSLFNAFLTGTVYVINGQVAGSYILFNPVTCALKNIGANPVTGASFQQCYISVTNKPSGGINSAQRFFNINALSPSGTLVWSQPITPGPIPTPVVAPSSYLYINVDNERNNALQSIYATGQGNFYVIYDIDYSSTTQSIPESNEANNDNVYPFTVTPSMYNLNFVDVECVLNAYSANGVRYSTYCQTGCNCGSDFQCYQTVLGDLATLTSTPC